MCAIYWYWKFAAELPDLSFKEPSNTDIHKIIQDATLFAVTGVHTLTDKRARISPIY